MSLKFILQEFLIQGPRLEMILSLLDELNERVSLLENKKDSKSKESKEVKGIRDHLKKRKAAEKMAEKAKEKEKEKEEE